MDCSIAQAPDSEVSLGPKKLIYVISHLIDAYRVIFNICCWNNLKSQTDFQKALKRIFFKTDSHCLIRQLRLFRQPILQISLHASRVPVFQCLFFYVFLLWTFNNLHYQIVQTLIRELLKKPSDLDMSYWNMWYGFFTQGCPVERVRYWRL